MTTHNEYNARTVQAGADLTADSVLWKVVSLNGTITNSSLLAAGLAISRPNSGGGLSVIYEGIAKADVAAAVSTIGFPLKATTSGWLTPCASGDLMVGRALATASSGDRIKVAVDFKTFGYFGG